MPAATFAAGVPGEVRVSVPDRLPDAIEVAVYYVVSEAPTNATKHARASGVEVELRVVEDVYGSRSATLSIRDDGVGGADPDRGSEPVGIRDRVEAIGGTLVITSPPEQGTLLLVTVPLA